jgi:hypothetical protein
MMALDFPTTPTIGQKYPQPPVGGVPVYTWDGEKWAINVTTGKTPVYADGSVPMAAQLTLITPPVAATDAAPKGYVDAANLSDRSYADAIASDNLVINGYQFISQEWPIGSGNPATGYRYINDQWYINNSPASPGVIGVCAALALGSIPSMTHALGLYSQQAGGFATGASGQCNLFQPIEGTRWAKLGWGTSNGIPVSIGFWVYSDTAGTFTLLVRNGANENDRTYMVPITVPAATWVYRTATIPPCTNGTWRIDTNSGAQLGFTVAAAGGILAAPNVWLTGAYSGITGQQSNLLPNQNSAFYITGVTAVPGSVPVSQAQCPQMRRGFDDELRLCQRYWSRRDYGSGQMHMFAKYIGAGSYDRYQFPVEMRTTPTMTISTTSGWSYVNAGAATVALGSVAPSAWDRWFGAFTAAALDADAAIRLYVNNTGVNQSIYHNARM